MTAMKKLSRGFTLIEILVVIGIIAILATIVIVAINPARQFAQAHNTQRVSNVNALLNAIGQNIADNKGVFTCPGTPLPTTPTIIEKGTGGVDLRPCLVPTYLPEMVFDPVSGNDSCSADSACATGSYNTDYTVVASTTGRITVAAHDPELGQTISVTR